jgi:hypothetical protein
MPEEVTFTAEQQELVNKLVGEARTKAREKAETDAQAALRREKDAAQEAALKAEAKWKELAERHEARVRELEPLSSQVEAYNKLVDRMLADKVKGLGDTAKKAVEALPGNLSAAEKLAWLDANTELFAQKGDGVGTPRKPKAKAGEGTPVLTTKVPIRL